MNQQTDRTEQNAPISTRSFKADENNKACSNINRNCRAV